jgi:hypothetical protein
LVGPVAARAGRLLVLDAAGSCRRELTPSLVNTLRRCDSTVRALMTDARR